MQDEPSLMLGILALIAGAIGLPSILLWALNRKGANRRIVVEERTLETNQFAAIMAQANRDNDKLRQDLSRYDERLEKVEREFRAQRRELDKARLRLADGEDRLQRLGDLFFSVVKRAGIELTDLEQHILQEVLPTEQKEHT